MVVIEPPPPIAAFAPAHAEILSIDSLTKPVWAGLRVGWVRAPAPIAARLARLKALADLGSPVLDQSIAARLLPRVDELTTTRAAARRRRLELLAEHLPGWRWSPPDGGSSLWIELPGTDAAVFAQVALRHGVEMIPGATMDAGGAHDNYIRLPFGFPDEVLHELVARLGRAWRELHRLGPAPSIDGPVV